MENERRIPIHPDHFERIDPELRARFVVEQGYGKDFGLTDEVLASLVGSVTSRQGVIDAADTILLPKPQHDEVRQLRDGQTVWGWPHCVQDREMTDVAMSKRLTLIAFEAMNHWTNSGNFGLHVFHKNNELAGYCSILHALQLIGSTGDYGRRLSAVVIGFGATARGAVTALNALGIHDVVVLTHREIAAVGSPIPSARIVQIELPESDVQVLPGPGRRAVRDLAQREVLTDDGPVALAPYLAGHDIVVNCTLQNPDEPLMFLNDSDLELFRPGSLIVDVSCDEGMGFSFARPTTFDEPMMRIGNGLNYYAVDHSPSYLWNAASWEVSEALLPFIEVVMDGPSAWDANRTIHKAIEIRGGQIVNEAISRFQGR
ncbi:N(5)-(carboxyethyl)ornithine synthase [Leucobacter viscericola]|nr:N(5)-(carboxyethyl)ornithine synthase [Leucobacter viscericola]